MLGSALSVLLPLNHPFYDALDEQDGKGQVVEASQSLGQSFIVSRQTSEARYPSEAAFDHRAAEAKSAVSVLMRLLDACLDF
jgi:hypothetical protein